MTWRQRALLAVAVCGAWGWAAHALRPAPATGTHLHLEVQTMAVGARAAPAPAAVSRQITTPAPPATVWLSVVHAGAQGVYLRPAPRRQGRIALWPEGTDLRVIGPPVTGEGWRWEHVRDPAGHQGWMAAPYLAPAPAPRHVQVARTGGRGIYLRRTPFYGAPLRAWPEGTLLLAFATIDHGQGQAWTYVRDPTGSLGWVASPYLITARPARATRHAAGGAPAGPRTTRRPLRGAAGAADRPAHLPMPAAVPTRPALLPTRSLA